MKKFIWLLRNKIIFFLLIVLPTDILSIILEPVFVKETPSFVGALYILWLIVLFPILNVAFFACFDPDEFIETTTDYFKEWWNKRPQ
jgi:hypothetical protein